MSGIKGRPQAALLTAAAIILTPLSAASSQPNTLSKSRFDRLSPKGQCLVQERIRGIQNSFSYGDRAAQVGKLTITVDDLPRLEEILSQKQNFRQVEHDAHKVDHMFPTGKKRGIFRRRVFAQLSSCKAPR